MQPHPLATTFTPWTRLKHARLDHRLELEDLAKLVNRSRIFMYQVEQGSRGVSDELLFRLADVLGIEPSELERSRPTVPPRVSVRRRRSAPVTADIPSEVAS